MHKKIVSLKIVQSINQDLRPHITKNIVEKNTPMKFTIAQKKSVIVLNRHNDFLDFTTPTKKFEYVSVNSNNEHKRWKASALNVSDHTDKY